MRVCLKCQTSKKHKRDKKKLGGGDGALLICKGGASILSHQLESKGGEDFSPILLVTRSPVCEGGASIIFEVLKSERAYLTVLRTPSFLVIW